MGGGRERFGFLDAEEFGTNEGLDEILDGGPARVEVLSFFYRSMKT